MNVIMNVVGRAVPKLFAILFLLAGFAPSVARAEDPVTLVVKAEVAESDRRFATLISIKKRLLNQDGVASVSADYVVGEFRVSYDPAVTSTGRLMGAMEELGYLVSRSQPLPVYGGGGGTENGVASPDEPAQP